MGYLSQLNNFFIPILVLIFNESNGKNNFSSCILLIFLTLTENCFIISNIIPEEKKIVSELYFLIIFEHSKNLFKKIYKCVNKFPLN